MISINNFNKFCLMTGHSTSGFKYDYADVEDNDIDLLSFVNDVFDEFETNLITLEKSQYNKLLFYYLKRIDENLQFHEVIKDEDIFRSTYNLNSIILKKDYNDYKSKFRMFINSAYMANGKLLSMIKNHLYTLDIEFELKKWEFESKFYIKEFESDRTSNTKIKKARSHDIYWNSSNETQLEEILDLFNLLVKGKFIDDSSHVETLQSLFIPNDNNQLTQMNWLKDLKSLIFLFKNLKEKGVISYVTLDYALIKSAFKIKNKDILIKPKSWIQYNSDTKNLRIYKVQSDIEKIVNQFI